MDPVNSGTKPLFEASDNSTTRREQWLGKGLESLLVEQAEEAEIFDVLIVGSGYGGAVAAQRLCAHNEAHGRPWQIAMLERGREYLPGAFPSTEAELPGHIRFTTPKGTGAQGKLEGLFDVRIGEDVSVVLANGVGGGSLINAGVMEAPHDDVWRDPAWPSMRRHASAFNAKATAMRQRLQAQPLAGDTPLRRQRTMADLGGKAVPITVAGPDVPQSIAGVKLDACLHCGDCATGCNHGAKISLDVGLLKCACDQGLRIYSGATVTRFRRAQDEPVWEVQVWHTDATLRKRMADGVWIKTHRLILAAGSLGSTELLMRSQSVQLQFSHQLGRRFSANGDILAAVHDSKRLQRGVANQEQAPQGRRVGPTITSMLDWRERQADNVGVVVQDLGVPGPLARFFGEGVTTAALLHRLDTPDEEPHHPDDRRADPCAVDTARVQRSMALAMIVRDQANGVMSPAPDDRNLPLDAGLRIDWPEARLDKQIDQAHSDLEKFLCAHPGIGGKLLPNPMWQLLPTRVAELLGTQPGPLLTVHPLGGCSMADNRDQGVVDAQGRVFNALAAAKATDVLPGLLVLDAAIVPTSLGINPALTIATLVDMAMDDLINDTSSGWCITSAPPVKTPAPSAATRPCQRPRYAPLSAPVRRAETKVQVLERLSGQVDIQIHGQLLEGLWMEVDLVYTKRALFPRRSNGSRQRFALSGHTLPIEVDPELSRIRIFPSNLRGSRFDKDRNLDDATAWFVAPLAEGSKLHFLHRDTSLFHDRRCRAWRAWLANRGARDTYQAVAGALSRLVGCAPPSSEKLAPCERLRQSLALASRAGEVRLFDYELRLQRPSKATNAFSALADQSDLQIDGSKRLTYERRGNPLTQLSHLQLDEGKADAPMRFGPRRSLDLCPAYLAIKGMPLLRVVEQHDQPTAMLDLLSFGLFLARVLVNIHLWSLRKPDTAAPRIPQRLPGPLPDMPAPVVRQWQPDGAEHGEIRLTHYPHPKARQAGRVVLMIHGYSASGTTFAHPSVNPNLASALHRKGYEPWIVDLRTSCGMPTADDPWIFEDIALVDIPAAMREVCAQTGARQIHLVTHCMGSAMLSLLLQSAEPQAAASAQRIRSWTMSQFGPRMRFSPANMLRAYLVSWWRHALPHFRYDLRPGGDVPGVSANLFDRLVAALPYLDDDNGSEFNRENPSPWTPWRTTPWVGTRHRLDALIGRTFDSRNMSDDTLAYIDDFFGPINLYTITQPIYFAQYGQAVLNRGRERPDIDASSWLAKVPMLSLHGQTNGLADPETANLLRKWKEDRQLDLDVHDEFTTQGHQDMLIGKDCAATFDLIAAFLDQH